MKKFTFMVLLGLSLTAANAAEKGKWTGYISDSHCGVKGNSDAHASCAAKCLKEGALPVLVVGDKVYKIENPDKVTAYAGKKVEVKGNMTGDSIKVISVKS